MDKCMIICYCSKANQPLCAKLRQTEGVTEMALKARASAIGVAVIAALLSACGASGASAESDNESPSTPSSPPANIRVISSWTDLPSADPDYDQSDKVRVVVINGACLLENFSYSKGDTNFTELPASACNE